jgi:hypothetical protein
MTKRHFHAMRRANHPGRSAALPEWRSVQKYSAARAFPQVGEGGESACTPDSV